MASPVDVAVNPNDAAQRYVLWGNGRVDSYGGAVPVAGQDTWYDSMITMPVAVALHVTDWSTGAGYVLDLYGGFHPLNGAPAIDGAVYGVPYVENYRNYVDWAWNPSGNGQGYALSVYGQLHEFGGATPAPRQGGRWTQPFAKKLAVDWGADGVLRALTLDAYGALHPDFGASVTAWSAYWPYQDFARDFAVTAWTGGAGGGAQGHVLDLFGGVHEFGGAPDTWGWPYNPGGDVARALAVISTASPQRFWQVWSGGQQYEYVSSSPPSVTVVAPSGTVTTTTRPVLGWTVSDAERDAQQLWQAMVFAEGFAAGRDMSDPMVWRDDAVMVAAGTDPTTRGVALTVDLGNGGYRGYVAIRDAAGQWSPWASGVWTQDVTPPVAPSGLTATADEGTFSVVLSVSATTGGSADLVRFEASDDGGLSWVAVRGADAVTLAATTVAADYDVPLGVTRVYRAVAYAVEPRVASAPSNTDTATVSARTYVLTAVDDSALGGEMGVQDPSEWTRPVVAGVFQGVGSDYVTVVSDGAPKGRRLTLNLIVESRGGWSRVAGLLEANSTLVYRDPFGEVVYCRLVGDWQRAQLPAAPMPEEDTPLRHLHRTQIPLVEVAPPHLSGA